MRRATAGRTLAQGQEALEQLEEGPVGGEVLLDLVLQAGGDQALGQELALQVGGERPVGDAGGDPEQGRRRPHPGPELLPQPGGGHDHRAGEAVLADPVERGVVGQDPGDRLALLPAGARVDQGQGVARPVGDRPHPGPGLPEVLVEDHVTRVGQHGPPHCPVVGAQPVQPGVEREHALLGQGRGGPDDRGRDRLLRPEHVEHVGLAGLQRHDSEHPAGSCCPFTLTSWLLELGVVSGASLHPGSG